MIFKIKIEVDDKVYSTISFTDLTTNTINMVYNELKRLYKEFTNKTIKEV